jgi:hypothetical protein
MKAMKKPILEKSIRQRYRLTVGLLVTSTGTGTAELENVKKEMQLMNMIKTSMTVNISHSLTYLLGFAATGIGNKESTVELDEDFLDFLLGGLIDELLVEGNDSLGKSLTDGIDLGSVT